MSNLIKHPIAPVFDANSKVLILGSFPSVKSREQGFFYGHKQNRFWQVLAKVFNKIVPETIAEKREFLSSIGVAVWDVISECEITGSADGSIKNVKPNDLSVILNEAKIEKIFVNGKTAAKYYEKYIYDDIKIKADILPSTSPANAAWSLDRLIEEWSVIK